MFVCSSSNIAIATYYFPLQMFLLVTELKEFLIGILVPNSLFTIPRHLRTSTSLLSGTLSYNQLLAAQVKAAANSTSSGKQAKGSASKTTANGTQVSSVAAVPKQPVTAPLSKPNIRTSTARVAGNLQVSDSSSSPSTTVKKTPSASQSVSPAVYTPNTISTQKAVVNLPVSTLSSAACPQVASRALTPTTSNFVNIAPKTTNASAASLPTSTVQAVPGSSSAPTTGSLVTSASNGLPVILRNIQLFSQRLRLEE